MKKILVIFLILGLTSGCASHMTAVKYQQSQLSYCPPNQRAGYVNPNIRKGNNFSYSKPKHKTKRGILKSLNDSRSYSAPKSHYKNGRMKGYKRSLPKYKYKRY